jgi:predicted helicase
MLTDGKHRTRRKDVLKAQFGQTLGSEGVHILDPFTGTGTFITRLLQSGLIAPEELARKYREEIHANEIVLLAYYIAAINIETVYQEQIQGELAEDAPYEPFRGILLTDTFQMYEQERDMVANLLPDNSERRTRQKELDIRVILGNPPYSSGQKNANDNAANISYANLDQRISETYVAESSNEMGKSKAYDSYIRAIRWASDRIGEAGVVCFVSGGGWIERSFGDGIRKCLLDEYSSLYLLNLRGDIQKNMLSGGAAKEGENVFGSGSMTSIVIVMMVKNPYLEQEYRIHYLDIGDDLKRHEKLRWIRTLGCFGSETWKSRDSDLRPDAYCDWIGHRDRSFDQYIALLDKKGVEKIKVFETYSMGVKTNRDQWACNFSKANLQANMMRTIDFYNSERLRLEGNNAEDVAKKVDNDSRKIKWTTDILRDLSKGINHKFDSKLIVPTLYRPFTHQFLYSSKSWNWTRHLMPLMLPESKEDNLLIQVSGVGSRASFSVLGRELING